MSSCFVYVTFASTDSSFQVWRSHLDPARHKLHSQNLNQFTHPDMLNLFLNSLYFILPAYLANMFPVIFGKLNLPLSKPINEKLFGTHKTWKGFYLGYLGALTALYLQSLLYQNFTPPNSLLSSAQLPLVSNSAIFPDNFLYHPLLNYAEINPFFYAFLFGIGALTGDLLKSFFKRRIGIKPGQPWLFFDQLDFVLGALVFLAPFYLPPWQNIVAILLITPILHLLTNLIGYALKLKKVWW